VGDLSDLERLGAWSAGLGAGLVLVNPLHASDTATPQQPSPYYASSRCFMNPIYLSMEDVPGAGAVAGFSEAAAEAQALNARRLIDRDKVWQLKSGVLEAVFHNGVDEDALRSYRRLRGEALEHFATFCAIREIEGGDWRSWPAVLRHPRSAAGALLRTSPGAADRIRFHSWVQLLLDQQMSRARRAVGVVQDLAVGADPGGADAWIWQDLLAHGMSIGAPPDEFATHGQDWGLAPFDPWRLRASGYVPWTEVLRAGFRHGAGLRLDHVMGLFRLYWIPDAIPDRLGAYVRYPHHDLLNILALEAQRAGAWVVGEDLGTVEDEVRDDLRERQVLTYRVWWFETTPTSEWPEPALGAVTTHDLPTVAGVISGRDLEAQRRLGLDPNEESSRALRLKVLERTGWKEEDGVEEAVRRVYEDLSQAPCLLLSATLDDVLAVEERPNMPGTVDEWPNWSIALPVPLEGFEEAPLARRIATALSREGSDDQCGPGSPDRAPA
jgi:4-alpha-glucanotransferase